MTLRIAARSIDFGTLVVLAAAIGVAAAVSESGLAAQIAALLTRLGGGDPTAALAVVFVGRIVMANLITNTASAVFLFPIALSIAEFPDCVNLRRLHHRLHDGDRNRGGRQ